MVFLSAILTFSQTHHRGRSQNANSFSSNENQGKTINFFGVAKFDGQSWTSVGDADTALNGEITDILCVANKLYVIGDFFIANDQLKRHLAVWDGIKWSGLDLPDGEIPRSIHSFQNELYLLSEWRNKHTSRLITTHLSRWHDNAWLQLDLPSNSGIITSVKVINDFLVLDTSNSGYYKWDGKTILQLASWNKINGEINWCVENAGFIYIGGSSGAFPLSVGSTEKPIAQGVACFEGGNWVPLKEGLDGARFSAAAFNNYLYVLNDEHELCRWSFDTRKWEKPIALDRSDWPRDLVSTKTNLFVLCDHELRIGGSDDNFINLKFEPSEQLKTSVNSPHKNLTFAIICSDEQNIYLAGISSIIRPYTQAEIEQLAVAKNAKNLEEEKIKQAKEAQLLVEAKVEQQDKERIALDKQRDQESKARQIPPILNNIPGPSFTDTVAYINVTLKKTGGFMYYDPKRAKMIISFAQNCLTIFDLADFDPTSTEFTSAKVKIICKDREAKVSWICGENTIQTTSFIEIDCSDFGSNVNSEPQAKRLATALAHLIEMCGGKKSLF